MRGFLDMSETLFKKWCINENDLEGINPVKARDLIVECFFEAQKETFKRVSEKTKNKSGRSTRDEDVLKTVTAAIKLAFKDVEGDFENPTKESLTKVVEYLAKRAGTWGTPEDIINHHKGQIQKVLSYL